MTFAIIKTGGKQYRVKAGDILTVEKLVPAKDGKITFEEVLLVDDGQATQVGLPMVAGAKVTAELVEEGRGKKVTTIKFKSKSNYKKRLGHRQPYSKIKIGKISNS